MKNEIDYLIEEAEKEEKYFENYLKYAKKIKRTAKELLGRVKVFVFGSILRKNEAPQDIDVLIISPKLKTNAQKSKARVKLWERLGFSAPFELHLVSPDEYKNWYKFFIKEKIEIK